jgi:Phage integrase family
MESRWKGTDLLSWSNRDFVALGSGTQSHQVLVFPGKVAATLSGISQLGRRLNLNRSNPKTTIPFRPDIEGLRALAVGLVIASHAELPVSAGRFCACFCGAVLCLVELLKEWRKVAPFPSKDDWVFASKRAKGKRPIWGQSIMRKQIHPAIENLGIKKRIGWHTFRHSYSTLLRQLGTDIKVQQDLLRHSSARLTLDTLHTSRHAGEARGAKRGGTTPSTGLISTFAAPTTSDSSIST